MGLIPAVGAQKRVSKECWGKQMKRPTYEVEVFLCLWPGEDVIKGIEGNHDAESLKPTVSFPTLPLFGLPRMPLTSQPDSLLDLCDSPINTLPACSGPADPILDA